jgi:hypothetical protein
MTADAADLLGEIRRSGGHVTLVGCDRLKLVAPTALLPELAVKLSCIGRNRNKPASAVILP